MNNNELVRRVLTEYQAGARRTLDYFKQQAQQNVEKYTGLQDAEVIQATKDASDNFDVRQYQAHIFDYFELRLKYVSGSDHDQLRTQRNLLANDFGYANYFEAYCETRGIDSSKIVGLAKLTLSQTWDRYKQILKENFPASPTYEDFDSLYKLLLTQDPQNYPWEFIKTEAVRIRKELSLEVDTDITFESITGLATNVNLLTPRHVHAFLPNGSGLESYRALYHALGHAAFTLNPENFTSTLLGVNIAATEIAAFTSQDIALTEAPSRTTALIKSMPIYYLRLYALRVLSEYEFYATGSTDSISFEKHMALRDYPKFAPAKNLNCVGFVLGFNEFIDRSPEATLESVKNCTSNNYDIAQKFNCLSQGISNNSRVA